MKYYVSAAAATSGNGSKEQPFKTISEAAALALPGDEVIVAPGIYREAVDPKYGGTSENRIVYRSEVSRGAVITGAEPAANWQHYEGDTWVLRIPNTLFGNYNPYTTLIFGDWYFASANHTGEVYLNGKSMYETDSLEKVLSPEIYMPSWDRAFTKHKWFTTQDGDTTVIYANFQGKNPNEETVEINVRPNCFYPSETGKGYITLSGFVVKQAATQWAPPTAYQEGMIGPHWSKGWIIEDCEVSDSKCSGISLGKYLQPNNNNKWFTRGYKDGTQTERDCICQAQYEGWTKENIGSHIVRGCEIHDCGQTGIVGHLGGVFSLIEDNHIHHINNKHDLAGAEIGGIKMHAAIDCTYRRNHIHHCTRGIWLDWQAQGTRVTQNIFHDNVPPYDTEINDGLAWGEDLFIEVSHGPTLVDNNLLLSTVACRLATQGCAFVHNFIAGSFTCVGEGTDNGGKKFSTARYTPYHVPHRTEVAGFMTIIHGDMQFYNNIFVQQEICRDDLQAYIDKEHRPDLHFICGTKPYDGYPTVPEWEYRFTLNTPQSEVDKDRYYDHLPVIARGNAYYNGALPYDKEADAIICSEKIWFSWDDEKGFATNLYETEASKNAVEILQTADLREAFEPEQAYENPDGTPILFDADLCGNPRAGKTISGPFA